VPSIPQQGRLFFRIDEGFRFYEPLIATSAPIHFYGLTVPMVRRRQTPGLKNGFATIRQVSRDRQILTRCSQPRSAPIRYGEQSTCVCQGFAENVSARFSQRPMSVCQRRLGPHTVACAGTKYFQHSLSKPLLCHTATSGDHFCNQAIPGGTCCVLTSTLCGTSMKPSALRPSGSVGRLWTQSSSPNADDSNAYRAESPSCWP